MIDNSATSRSLGARRGRVAPLGRLLPGPLDDHALLPWRFHPAMRAADGELSRV